MGRLGWARRSASQDTWRPGGPFPIGARHAEKESRWFSASPVPLSSSSHHIPDSGFRAAGRRGAHHRPGRRRRRDARCPAPGFSFVGGRSDDVGRDRRRRPLHAPAPGEGRATVRVALDGFRADPVTVDSTARRGISARSTLEVSAVSEAVVVSAGQVEIPLSEVASSVTVIDRRRPRGAAAALGRGCAEERARTGAGEHRRPAARRPACSRAAESPTTRWSSSTACRRTPSAAASISGSWPTANIDRIEVVRGPQSALFGSNAIGSVVRIVSRRGGQPSGLLPGRGRSVRHVARGRLDRRQPRRPGMGRLLRSAADRRHERREHGRRRDRRQRRLHATIVRGIARVAQQRVVAARRRAARRRRARLSRSVRQQPGRQLQRDRYDRRVARIRERRRPSPGRRCSPRASGCRHRRTTTKSKATSSASSTSPHSYSRRGTGRFQSDFTHSRRDWISRRGWSSSVSAPAAPTSPAKAGRKSPSSAASRATSSKAGGPRRNGCS